MPVFRVEKTGNYTVLSNDLFKDVRLSWKAKGILSNMLSLPENWDYSAVGLTKLTADGLDVTRSALKELEECGYLIRRPIKEKGKFVDWEYLIFESSEMEKPILKKSVVGNPETDNPYAEKPEVEKPKEENPQQLSKERLSTEEVSTDRLKTDKSKMKETKGGKENGIYQQKDGGNPKKSGTDRWSGVKWGIEC